MIKYINKLKKIDKDNVPVNEVKNVLKNGNSTLIKIFLLILNSESTLRKIIQYLSLISPLTKDYFNIVDILIEYEVDFNRIFKEIFKWWSINMISEWSRDDEMKLYNAIYYVLSRFPKTFYNVGISAYSFIIENNNLQYMINDIIGLLIYYAGEQTLLDKIHLIKNKKKAEEIALPQIRRTKAHLIKHYPQYKDLIDSKGYILPIQSNPDMLERILLLLQIEPTDNLQSNLINCIQILLENEIDLELMKNIREIRFKKYNLKNKKNDEVYDYSEREIVVFENKVGIHRAYIPQYMIFSNYDPHFMKVGYLPKYTLQQAVLWVKNLNIKKQVRFASLTSTAKQILKELQEKRPKDISTRKTRFEPEIKVPIKPEMRRSTVEIKIPKRRTLPTSILTPEKKVKKSDIPKYRVIRSLEKGRFAEAYLIETDDKEKYVMKVLSLEDSFVDKASRREVEILHKLKKRCREFFICIVREYIQIIKGKKQRVIWFEYYPNTIELFDYIYTYEYKPEYQIKIIKNLLKGLIELHKLNIVHRDIKPENILINPFDLHIYYIDYGSSCLKSDKECLRETQLGTRQFLPPLQDNFKTFTNWVNGDIWSLGITLIDLVWGLNSWNDKKNYNSQESINKGISKLKGHPEIKKILKHMLIHQPKKKINLEKIFKSI